MQDEAGFAAFVAARGPALRRLAWLLTADLDAADDLVQEALARVVPRWHRIAAGAHEAYVRAAVRSIWIDGWRRRRGLRLVPWPEPAAAGRLQPPDPAADDESVVRLTLDQALARLTARQRTVLILRYYEDLSHEQVAAAMGCSVSTSKSQAQHALGRLRLLAPELAETFGREPVPNVEVSR